MKQQKRNSYEEKSVLAYMKKGESMKEAEYRLQEEWNRGEHPVQLERAKKQRK